MIDTPATPHAPMPAPTGANPPDLPVERATLNAPVITALLGIVALAAAAVAGAFALAGAL